ncbi:hypothetical protein [Comamonas odontotermitis]|uniref:hypothetical protein n=1 Tax=Comamonas odontotermitis TaxID=379895 RepID=UPI003751292C
MEWNRDTPWRQGHLLCSEAIKAFNLGDTNQTLAIVATHDCDLAQSPDGEPNIEIIVGSLINEANGNVTHAKNSRKLHLEFIGEQPLWSEFQATAKISIDKMELNKFKPRLDFLLSPENSAVFQMWLASRYRRSAFPDEFERRLVKECKLAEKIAKAVKPHGERIVGVFFDVDEGVETTRNGPDDTYTLDIVILHSADIEPASTPSQDAASAAAKAIEDSFQDKLFKPTGTWQHIELRFCESISEATLTYQQFKQMKRWRLDHISLAAEPQHPQVAE